MIPLSLAEIAAATGAELAGADPDAVVTGPVEYDSRRVGPGGLFVAFSGEKVDGHDFAAAAVDAGAVAVLGTRPVAGVPMLVVPERAQPEPGSGGGGHAPGSSAVGSSAVGSSAAGSSAVGSSAAGSSAGLTAMGRLARTVLDRLPGLTVVGITGSSGKTTTKDMIAQLLGRLGPCVAAAGSLNNELGLPHTVLRADAGTRFLVLEMGSRGAGHLTYLCEIAPPDIGVVINVGVAHIGEFGSVEGIAVAKGELVEALDETGTAVLNADDERVRAMAGRTRARVVLAGEAPDAAVRAEQVSLDAAGRASFVLVTAQGRAPVRLAVTGRHQVGNALLAATVAIEAGMDLPDVAAALGELRPLSNRRMDVFDRADGVTVIDDSYNANPGSTATALNALAALGRGDPSGSARGAGAVGDPSGSAHGGRGGAGRGGRRTIAVLGYHAELGDYERAGHEEVGRLAAQLGVDLLVVVGDSAAPIHDGAVSVATWGGKSVQVTDQPAAIALLREELAAGDVVLVKGSRYRTWDVVDALREGATP